MNTELMFSSKTDLHATPQSYFDEIAKEFDFNLDVCALPENAKCTNFFTPAIDGLKQLWNGVCWMNPPYGKTIGEWIRKAFESSRGGYGCVLIARQNRYAVVS